MQFQGRFHANHTTKAACDEALFGLSEAPAFQSRHKVGLNKWNVPYTHVTYLMQLQQLEKEHGYLSSATSSEPFTFLTVVQMYRTAGPSAGPSAP